MKYLRFTVLFFLFSQNVVLAQMQEKKVLEYLKKEMQEQKIPGLQIAVIKDNKLILSKSLGLANIPFSIPAKNNTIFSINSIAKIFASTAIMQLVEKDKLKIEDPISNYLDDLPINWRQVTLKQLLSHISGLPDIEDSTTDELVGGKGQDSAWIKVQKMPLQFKPGEDFSYNATNYVLIQKIIEKYGGMPFEQFIKVNQFDVAGMNKTIYGNSFDVLPNKSPTYCFYHFDKAKGDYVKGEKLVETYESFPSMMRADAGVFSTAEDIAKWVMALQNKKLLKKELSIQTMWEPVKLNNGKYGGFGGILEGYALGWPVIIRENHPAATPIGGGRASLSIYPKDDLTIILFTNLSGIPVSEMTDSIAKFYLLN
ncbi:serine hydrolase domain-containing protein [Flavobacterium sp. MC2016-06]|uniref:serine hydrolase domain-containing protein n=1 Tax=Flavobacterium sp. MC2016-06 TaxID=2676308 RepID=UPI0012BA8F3D|nr:serine hydrolase domain-containing protein [Flavobacterium sp. MC2016-06]MBU3860890.1 beta-lactamase family protein [Flavobacterium sp. MC2016-06]